MTRARHEAGWTHEQATVKGRRGRSGWLMLAVGFTLVAALSIYGYNRLMDFRPIVFELYTCQTALDEGSTWADVQAAGCSKGSTDQAVLTMWHGGDQSTADTVAGSSWTFEDVPNKTVLNAMQLDTSDPASSVLLVEPDKEAIRTVLTSDSAGVRWSGHIGYRPSTTMWVLVTPQG